MYICIFNYTFFFIIVLFRYTLNILKCLHFEFYNFITTSIYKNIICFYKLRSLADFRESTQHTNKNITYTYV